jgi:hypothetical protein
MPLVGPFPKNLKDPVPGSPGWMICVATGASNVKVAAKEPTERLMVRVTATALNELAHACVNCGDEPRTLVSVTHVAVSARKADARFSEGE